MNEEELRKWIGDLILEKGRLMEQLKRLQIINYELKIENSNLKGIAVWKEELSEEECADRYYESKRWC